MKNAPITTSFFLVFLDESVNCKIENEKKFISLQNMVLSPERDRAPDADQLKLEDFNDIESDVSEFDDSIRDPDYSPTPSSVLQEVSYNSSLYGFVVIVFTQ